MEVAYKKDGTSVDITLGVEDTYPDRWKPNFETLHKISEENHLENLTVDLASVPEREKIEYMAVTLGLFGRVNLRYKGIKKETVEREDWGNFREIALSSV